MTRLITKLAPKVPELLGRAAMGDPTAIALLGITGVAAAAALIKEKSQENSTSESSSGNAHS